MQNYMAMVVGDVKDFLGQTLLGPGSTSQHSTQNCLNLQGQPQVGRKRRQRNSLCCSNSLESAILNISQARSKTWTCSLLEAKMMRPCETTTSKWQPVATDSHKTQGMSVNYAMPCQSNFKIKREKM